MVAITDLSERNRLATIIPGSHLRVPKVSPIVLEMRLRGSPDASRGSFAPLRSSPAPLRGSLEHVCSGYCIKRGLYTVTSFV
eukprot:5886000-Pleurochrysis_carterae.AAC.2